MTNIDEWFSESKRQRKGLSKQTSSDGHLWKTASAVSKEESDKLAKKGIQSLFLSRKKNAARSYSDSPSTSSAYQVAKSNSAPHSGGLTFPNLQKIPDEDMLPKLKQELLQMGFNISSYKTNYLKRRLRVLLRRAGCSTYAKYLKMLQQEPREIEKLKKAFSINVTRFFRNLDSFWALQKIMLPELLLRSPLKSPAKFWSAGCVMGPEPYTLAMLVFEFQSSHPKARKVRIVGTDLNSDLLRIAELGEYATEAFEEAPASYKTRYATPRGDGCFRISQSVKSMVHFQQHDLLSPISMGTHDFIACRSVLICFTREQQKKLFSTFSCSLPPGEMLLLGRTESLRISFRSVFEDVDGHHRIYRRIKD
ncbi:MAG: CheR family methyltransferase [Candidatus Hodarchaeota archaeon]